VNVTYIPRRGERVRVTQVCLADLNPVVEVGDEFEVAFACISNDCAELGVPPGEWLLVRRMGDTPGVSTWCRVVPLAPLDWTPPDERPTTIPPGDDEGVKAFESSVANEGEWRARLHNVARLAFPCDVATCELPPMRFDLGGTNLASLHDDASVYDAHDSQHHDPDSFPGTDEGSHYMSTRQGLSE
jgi:hypothetical protein